jgi:hypothetical protein
MKKLSYKIAYFLDENEAQITYILDGKPIYQTDWKYWLKQSPKMQAEIEIVDLLDYLRKEGHEVEYDE